MARFFSRHYGGELSNWSALWRSIGIRPYVYQGFSPIWLFNDCLHTYLCLIYRPLWIIPRRVKWFDFSVGTIEVKHQTHLYSEGRSASGLMFIRGLPYTGISWLSTPLFVHILSPVLKFSTSSSNDCLNTYFCKFYRPLWIIPRRVKWFYFSVGTLEVNHQIHRHSEGQSASCPMFIRGFHLYGYLMTFSKATGALFYRPLWIIPRRVKWLDFSVDTMEVNLQTHRYSEGLSASGPMFIRGFPLYGYFMALYTPCFAYFIARCEMFRVQ